MKTAKALEDLYERKISRETSKIEKLNGNLTFIQVILRVFLFQEMHSLKLVFMMKNLNYTLTMI